MTVLDAMKALGVADAACSKKAASASQHAVQEGREDEELQQETVPHGSAASVALAAPLPADMCFTPERNSQEGLLHKGAVSHRTVPGASPAHSPHPTECLSAPPLGCAIGSFSSLPRVDLTAFGCSPLVHIFPVVRRAKLRMRGCTIVHPSSSGFGIGG